VHAGLRTRIERNRELYRSSLRQFLTFADHFVRIPKTPADSVTPCWHNGFLSGLDAVALYSFMALRKPRNYFEIGSGYSTQFARRAIQDHRLPSSITSIDPAPRAAVDSICDRSVRSPVEQLPLEIFDELQADDILFVDPSHRVFMNSDSTAIFLDILPRLAPGVLVQFHDIFLPLDYPPEWSSRFYSEQYLLACYILADGQRFGVTLPNAFIKEDRELNEILSPLWQRPELHGVERHGCSFWIESGTNRLPDPRA
jgi:predicted O-methyltransferase YrrM